MVPGAGAATATTSAPLAFNPPDNFSGDLSVVGKKLCKRDRLVTLQYLGKDGTSAPQFVEAAKSDVVGHYEINVVGGTTPGHYRVIVKKRIIRKKNLKCKPFVSPAQSFPSG